MKKCTVCLETKLLVDFYNFKNSKDGKSYRCKQCDGKSRKKWREANLEKAQLSQRGRNLKHKYGITIEEYNDLLKKQNGCCVICGIQNNYCLFGLNKTLSFAVDHCHTTGRIRGLLCNQCNRSLGLLKDDVNILKRAIEYLETH